MHSDSRLLVVAWLFLKLGTISFGGPAAHIALMEQEVVRKRAWLDREHFLDLLAATNLIPGPNATEMAMHIGYVHAGWPGLIVGGAAFILPAFLISLVLSWVYGRFGTLPEGQALFYGINPVVMAIVLVATYRLGRTALRDRLSMLLSGLALAAALLDVDEALILLTAGVAGILAQAVPGWLSKRARVALLAPLVIGPVATLQCTALDGRLIRLGLYFLKVGSLLFGSGMVLFAFIQRDVVTRYQWLSQQQLIDAIAVGQMTPGPVLSSATFIGYLVSGWAGAIVATAAVFLPSFVIVSLVGPLIPRMRKSPTAQAFLRGVNAAVVALILYVSLALFRSAIVDIWTALIMGIGLVALLFIRIDTFWLVLFGAGAGLVRMLLT
ncbi:MAG: chromate efflux transporter [Anaerolineae bacterium]|jgi:chromate transporter|nr:chromate efflux transporter [Anaerolineae bacterium]